MSQHMIGRLECRQADLECWIADDDVKHQGNMAMVIGQSADAAIRQAEFDPHRRLKLRLQVICELLAEVVNDRHAVALVAAVHANLKHKLAATKRDVTVLT